MDTSDNEKISQISQLRQKLRNLVSDSKKKLERIRIEHLEKEIGNNDEREVHN